MVTQNLSGIESSRFCTGISLAHKVSTRDGEAVFRTHRIKTRGVFIPCQVRPGTAKQKDTLKGCPFVLVSQYQAKSNSVCPTLIDLKMGKLNPPEYVL